MSSVQQMQQHIYRLLQQQQWTEVEKCALQYLSTYPQDVNVRYYLAFARSRLNKMAEVQQDLEAILTISPDHDLAKNMLRQLREVSGVKQDTQAPPRSTKSGANAPQHSHGNSRKILGNRYEVICKLGQGGMGTVYKVHDLQLDRTVALKTLIAETDSEEQISRFIKEAKATAALDHPNIVRVHDIGVFEKTPYFTMDLVAGSSLKEFLKMTEVETSQIVDIMRKVVDAVHYAHGKGIIHRDIKPANIMISEDLQPKIMDFGLAKVVGSQDNISKTGDVVGTPAYMSPEQARGDKKVNRRADVYSLGATLYQAITGRAPFEGVTYINIIQQVWNDEPIHPRSLNPEASVELEAIILKCLEKDPKKRYKSAAMLAKDLSNFLEHRPIIAKPPTTWTRLQKLARRHRSVFMAASAVLLSVLVGSAISVWQWRIAVEARQKAEEQKTIAEDQREKAQQARGEAITARQKAEKDAKANAVRLSKIVLVKAEEAYEKGNWRECGVFAGMGLEVIKNMPKEEVAREREKGKALVQAAMHRYPLIRKVFPQDKEAWMGKTTWHPDHKTLAFFSSSNSISRIFIWNIDSNQQIALLTQQGRINSIEWSGDGKFLLAISTNMIRVWDIAKRAIAKSHPGAAFYKWYSSKHIITSLEPLTALDIFSGAKKVLLPLTQVAKAEMSRNRKYAAVLRQNEKDIDIWNIRTKKKIKTLKNATHREIPVMGNGKSYKSAINFLSLSPNGKFLLCYFYEDVTTLWNVQSGQKRNLSGHAKYTTTGAQWSNNSQYVATIARDKTIRIWDASGKGQIALLRSPNKHAFVAAKWSPDDRFLATSSFDTVIRLWDVREQQQISTFTGHKKIAHGEWSGDGGAFASYSAEKVVIWDVATPKSLEKIPAQEEGTINTISWNNSGTQVLHSVNNNIYITTKSGKQVAKFVGHSDLPVFLEWNPQDTILASSSYDKTVRLWRMGSPSSISTLPHQSKVLAAVWSPDGKILASLASKVHFWDWQRQTKIKTIQASGIHWSSDGERFMTTQGNEIDVWRKKDWQKITTLRGHKNPVGGGAVWSPNGKFLSSRAKNSGFVRIWDMTKYQMMGKLVLDGTNFNTLAWRPDSRVIATGGFEKTIYLWDVFSQKKIAKLQADSPVYALRWHKDGKILAANTVRNISMWEVDIRKATLGAKISQDFTGIEELPKWYTKIIADVPRHLEKPMSSPFDLHLKIPGRFIEYAMERQPQKTTQELFEAKVTEAFGFEETEVYTPTGSVTIKMPPGFGQKK
ncbi:protein kinase domain-containing protein [Candidatus Uabimicrobium amorphum]|uniref:non-specific serine/threonine protein kinase n=1 Tax=Uabimicrobium amorphum TaxID=2596890 RepID=A0A5S9IW91_UABAM|nr:protein kinase [Candidatus Uabimicrobium amorphum]BBM87705.1 protein kinase [Candidatus Uabimicrobium amorphum]